MKKYYGNYLGICISNNDPQKRGRVQIFVPHIMPSMYEHWNQEKKDIYINCVGDNMINGLTSAQIQRLSQILPWAESASPIIGTSSTGNLVQQAAEALAGAAGQLVGGSAGAAAAKGVVGSFFNQSPLAEPTQVGGMEDLFKAAESFNVDKNTGLPRVNSKNLASTQGGSLCGVGSRSVVGAMMQSSYFKNGLGADRQSYASSLSQGNNYLQKSGFYQAPTSMPSSYLTDKTQWKVGDVITSAGGGGDGKGHIQVWSGTAWVSDHTQGSRIYDRNSKAPYSNFVLHRPNAAGDERLSQTMGKLMPSGTSSDSSQESTSVSGEVAAASPHQNPAPLDTDLESNQYGNVANPNISLDLGTTPQQAGLTNVVADPKGRVNPDQLNSALEQRIANSSLNGYVPTDGAKFGVDGSPKSWANYLTKLAEKESSYNINTRNNDDPGGSLGIFQVSVLDGKRYGANPSGGNWTESQLKDPMNQIETVVKIHEKQVLKSGTIALGSGKGAGGYFAKASMNKIAADVAAGKIGEFDASAVPTGPVIPTGGTNMVNNVDKHGPTVTQNLNGMAKGLFTFPAAGAMLWLFFREGNPLYPVYFGASYSQAEWKSAYRYGSDGPGYRPAATPDNPTTSTGGVMNLNGVGGIRWEETVNPENHIGDQKSIMFFGEDGSNMFIGKGYHQIFSKFDRRDQVEGDKWETTLGFKEEWVQGDKNEVVLGDVFVKIGNVSQPAVDAVERIQQLIKEIQAPLKGKGSAGSGSQSKTSHMSEKQKSVQQQVNKFNEQVKDKAVQSPADFNKKHGTNSYFSSERPQNDQKTGNLLASAGVSFGDSQMVQEAINSSRSNTPRLIN